MLSQQTNDLEMTLKKSLIRGGRLELPPSPRGVGAFREQAPNVVHPSVERCGPKRLAHLLPQHLRRKPRGTADARRQLDHLRPKLLARASPPPARVLDHVLPSVTAVRAAEQPRERLEERPTEAA